MKIFIKLENIECELNISKNSTCIQVAGKTFQTKLNTDAELNLILYLTIKVYHILPIIQ